jgi:hypothetical protein
MTKLGTPGVVAVLALALAVATWPDLGLMDRHAIAGGVVAGLCALLVISLGDRRTPRRLVALGVGVVAIALAYDAVRGAGGTVLLSEGEGTRTFEEVGPAGRRLGLRPLDDQVVLESAEGEAGVVLAEGSAPRRVRLAPTRAASLAGYRMGNPRRVPTGTARVVLRVSDGAEGEVTLREGESGRAGDLDLTVERYFPDFAVENNQPFTRSNEPRNPAALLQARRGAQSWKVFVIRALPGIHRPQGLDRTITLAAVEADQGVQIEVHREPAALLAGLGLVVAMVGVAWSRW